MRGGGGGEKNLHNIQVGSSHMLTFDDKGGPLCVEMVFSWTFPRNQDATVKLKFEFISIKFWLFFNILANPKLICPIQTIS